MRVLHHHKKYVSYRWSKSSERKPTPTLVLGCSLLERAPGPRDITGTIKLSKATVAHAQTEAQSQASYPRTTLCGATYCLWACGHSKCFSLNLNERLFSWGLLKWQWFSGASEPWQSLFWKADPSFRRNGCGVRRGRWQREDDAQQWVLLAQCSDMWITRIQRSWWPVLLPSIFKDRAEWSFLIATARVCSAGPGLFPHFLFLPLCRVVFLVR